MAEHAVALQCLDRGRLCVDARRRLSEALGAPVPDPDNEGIVEVQVEAPDFDGALARAWDAMAAAGADDHLVFAEHPDIPQHWRRRSPADGPPGTPA
jgi:hypothetical protein